MNENICYLFSENSHSKLPLQIRLTCQQINAFQVMSFEAGVFSNVVSSFDGDQYFGVVWYRRSSTWNLTNIKINVDIDESKM